MATMSDEIDAKAVDVAVEDTGKAQAVSWDSETEKKLRRKCDRHVLPCITLLFFMAFLDRTNIGERGLSYETFQDHMQFAKGLQAMRGFREWCKTSI